MKRLTVFLICIWAMVPFVSFSNEADVTNVKVTKDNKNWYRFSVTVLHDDKGWDHYADKWEVLDGEGNVLGVRVLHHPHVGEQPFTRQLSGVKIPDSVETITLRAHDSVHGYGGKTISVELP